MKKLNLKKMFPYIVAVVTFLLVSYIYFGDAVKGKVLQQSDISSHRAMSHELSTYAKETGTSTFWTNSMFSGMPTYLISAQSKGNYVNKVFNYLFGLLKVRFVQMLFIAMLGFFLLLRVFGVNPWLSILGSLASGLATYNIIIIAVGHNTKMMAIAFMPWVLASVVYAFKKNKLLGSLFFGVTFALQIAAHHPQITYYLAIPTLVFIIFESYDSYKKGILKQFFASSAFLLGGLVLAVGANACNLLITAEYAPYTMRGPSELTHNEENQSVSGLDKDYALRWSYGIGETINLMIPNFTGGASQIPLADKKNTNTELRKLGQNANRIAGQLRAYWGPQTNAGGTSGPMYLGAIMIFLFIFGLFVIKGSIKWWILVSMVIVLMLGWGRHMFFLSSFFLDYVPLYSKFRAPSMILSITQITVPLLGILALKKVFDGELSREEFKRAVFWSFGLTGGACLILWMAPSLAGSFYSPMEAQLPNNLLMAMIEDRQDMLQSDAIRSFFFILLSAATIWIFYGKNKKIQVPAIILSILVLIDLWGVDRRYLNSDNYQKKQLETNFVASTADKAILQDKEPNYRVLNLTTNIFNDATPSYFHKNIGGYSAGKLQRYQDLIEHNIQDEIQSIITALNNKPTPESLGIAMSRQNVLNMLNTKYYIYSQGANPLLNLYRNGNAWFVDSYEYVANPDEEIAKLKGLDTKRKIIVDERFKSILGDGRFIKDSTSSIKLDSYEPNKLVYSYFAESDQLVVFSEIYYDKGWYAYIDGNPVDHFRANYVLRAMKVPSGKHEIVFKFNPRTHIVGETISYASSILLLLLLVAVTFTSCRKVVK
ncbi:MAG: YfhO family protein [Bacteroidales bacterium]